MPIQDMPRQGLLEQVARFSSHRSKQHVITVSNATRRAAAGVLQSVQLLAEAGLKLKPEALTDSTANIGMRSHIGSRRVRHLNVRWLWTRGIVQAGRFSLQKVGTVEYVSHFTTKYHDEERLRGLMGVGGLRFTRELQLAALTVTPVVW